MGFRPGDIIKASNRQKKKVLWDENAGDIGYFTNGMIIALIPVNDLKHNPMLYVIDAPTGRIGWVYNQGVVKVSSQQ
jgi:hypothetical protein